MFVKDFRLKLKVLLISKGGSSSPNKKTVAIHSDKTIKDSHDTLTGEIQPTSQEVQEQTLVKSTGNESVHQAVPQYTA